MNLPNNRKTNNLRLLSFKFFAFGNGDDDDVLKLPEVFRKVLMVLVSINKLLVPSEKRYRLDSKKHLIIVHTHG
jgi:hypothetical protein